MRGSKICTIVAVTLWAIMGLSACTKKYITNYPITDSTHVRGVVRAWMCFVGDGRNNREGPWRQRFSVYTGEPAIVTLIRDNGFASVVETDDSSQFDLRLSAGSHKIVIETGWSYPPDTFYNVQLKPGDTTLTLDIVYATLDPLNIDCVFTYGSIKDTAGTLAEWNLISELNRRSAGPHGGFPVFNIDRSNPPSDSRHMDPTEYTQRVFIRYKLPIFRAYPGYGRLWNVEEACDALLKIIDEDTTGLFQNNFTVTPHRELLVRGESMTTKRTNGAYLSRRS